MPTCTYNLSFSFFWRGGKKKKKTQRGGRKEDLGLGADARVIRSRSSKNKKHACRTKRRICHTSHPFPPRFSSPLALRRTLWDVCRMTSKSPTDSSYRPTSSAPLGSLRRGCCVPRPTKRSSSPATRRASRGSSTTTNSSSSICASSSILFQLIPLGHLVASPLPRDTDSRVNEMWME